MAIAYVKGRPSLLGNPSRPQIFNPMDAHIHVIVQQSSAAQDIPHLLKTHLETLPPQHQLIQLTHLLHHVATTHEELALLAHHAWNYLLDNNLWQHQYTSLHHFKLHLDFDRTIQPLLQAATSNKARLQINSTAVQAHWGKPIQQAFPTDLIPPRITDGFSRELQRLSRLTDRHTATKL